MRRVYHLHPPDLARYTPREIRAMHAEYVQLQREAEEAMSDGG